MDEHALRDETQFAEALTWPAAPVSHIVAWYPGDLISDGPEVSNWEVITSEGWEVGRNGRWLLGDEAVTKNMNASSEQLQPLVTELLAPAGPIQLTPGTYAIEAVGKPGPFFRRGPWTFPMFEVTTPGPRQRPTPSEGT
ncbi:hypothetical protein AB0A98_39415 [Streptomyces chrestomyceticus]|uniref:hypothetical protein n=1 Tax=Streptomyces chrestomyceticus TaxID=68185 RepID=UPI0033D4DFB5